VWGTGEEWNKNNKAPEPIDRSKLSILQKEYQNKLLPIHYIEKYRKQRIERFENREIGDAKIVLEKRNRRARRRLERKILLAGETDLPKL
jgi:hypothetical protein